MKQKILFMLINMNVGGTEKSLLNLLDKIDKDKYEVTVLMLEEYGGFLGEIPNWINIKYLNNYSTIKEIYAKPPFKVSKQLIKKGHFKRGIDIGFSHLVYKITQDRSLYFKNILKHSNTLEEEYDVAIAYAGPMDLISYYVVNKIKAKKKIQWIHFDVTKIAFDEKFMKKLYSNFDKILVVSKEAKEKLDGLIPSLSFKTEIFHNIVSKDKIHKMADIGEGFQDDFDGTRILTVGRLSEEKGQDMIIPVVDKLIKEGYKIRWYILGEGSLRSKCEDLIKKYKLDSDVILLGANKNPYRYMKECDIYVQTSRYEGYCVTTMEAKVLYKPIVSTNVNGMREQIVNNENGIIVDISEEGIYEGIKKLLDNNDIRTSFESNLINKNQFIQ